MANAKFINCQPGKMGVQYFAAYDIKTPIEELEGIAKSLQSLQGVLEIRWGVTSDGHQKLKIVAIETVTNTDTSDIALKLKEFTAPELPYTADRLELTMAVCPCRFLSAKARMSFVPGLAPDDEESFRLHFAARTKQLPIPDIMDEVADGSYDGLFKAFLTVMRSLGAHVVESSVRFITDPKPCTHE